MLYVLVAGEAVGVVDGLVVGLADTDGDVVAPCSAGLLPHADTTASIKMSSTVLSVVFDKFIVIGPLFIIIKIIAMDSLFDLKHP
ncbi:hypothetical protein D3C73_843750 [compost metagenome]